MTARLHVGANAPSAYAMVLSAGDDVDLTTATSFTFVVQRPSGAVVSWDAVASAVSASSVTLTHVFATGDVDVVGTYSIFASFSVPGGTMRSETRTLFVVDQFA